jgi:hypothetical protein
VLLHGKEDPVVVMATVIGGGLGVQYDVAWWEKGERKTGTVVEPEVRCGATETDASPKLVIGFKG